MDGRKMKRERERKWWGNVRFIGFMGIMRTFMKMFQTSSVDVVQECQTVKLCLTSVECQSRFLKGNVNFCKNFAHVKMAHVKFLPLWRRMCLA